MADLPEYVQVCPLCDGSGRTTQTYTAGCGGGYYRASGACEMCCDGDPFDGVGYVYKATAKAVPRSVAAQIAGRRALEQDGGAE